MTAFVTASLATNQVAASTWCGNRRPGSRIWTRTDVLHAVNDGPFNVAFLLGVIGAIGYFALAVGLARAHAVPIGAAVLVAIGGAGTQLVMGGPPRSLLLLAIVVLRAGHTWIAASARAAGRRTSSPTPSTAVPV